MLLISVRAWAEKAAKQTLPSMALLEFLADMQEVDGKLVSPMDIQQPGLDIQPSELDMSKTLQEDKNSNTEKSAEGEQQSEGKS